MPALEAINLSKDYPTRGGPLSVLRECRLSLDNGAAAAIVGPSGSGKSTLLNLLGTLETPTAGRLTIGGQNPYALSEPDLAAFRNEKIGFIFQDHHLLPQCCVLENVLIPTLARNNGEDRAPRARQLLDRVGLSDRLDHLPSELSGGERQRVAVARALVNRPTLLLADEPTGNLDRTSADAVAELLLELQREEQAVLIVVTHSAALAARFSRRFEIIDGRLGEAR
jgi:lipoprotein-releasing system ATP-binding protein